MEIKCVCGREIYTFIVQLPACKECYGKYSEEGMKYLPMGKRTFFKSFLDKARQQGKGNGYTYHGY